MADYWIKMYHEILDDPKLATMPDRLWRRTMEIFLLAGKLSRDKSGYLPETNQLAWMLRMSSDDLLMDLKQLESAGILKRVEDGWLVVNFEKRQAATTSTERSRYFRQNEKKKIYYGERKPTKGIYKIECTKNNNVYIGSSVNCEKRIKSHFYDGKTFSDHWMYEDLKKFGKKAFKTEILEIVENESDLPESETYWINKFGSSGLYNSEMVGKQHRDRKATQTQRNVAQNTESETEKETESEAEAEREPARTRDPEPEADAFDQIRGEIEKVIGLPQGHDAVTAIQEMIKMGVESCDIQEAADWYRSNGKTIHSARSLLGPVKTALMKRKQMARAPAKKDVDITAKILKSEYAGFFKTGFDQG